MQGQYKNMNEFKLTDIFTKLIIESVDSDLYYHGTDKVIKGNIRLGSTHAKVRGVTLFKDLVDGFYITKNFEYAKQYAPKTGNVYVIRLKRRDNLLDATNIYSSEYLTTAFKNMWSNEKKPKSDFPFQNDFEKFCFAELNKYRQSNGKEPLDSDAFDDKVRPGLKPTDAKEWEYLGLGNEYLSKYIVQFDGIEFQRETIITNPSIIEIVKLIKGQ